MALMSSGQFEYQPGEAAENDESWIPRQCV